MSNPILIAFVVIVLVISLLWSLLRGLSKSRIRGICLILCAVGAVALTALLRQTIASEEFVNGTILPWLESAQMNEVVEAMELSPTLNNLVLNCAASLIAPIVCLIFFILLSFVTWVIFLIVTLILHGTLSAQDERSKMRAPRALVWGLVQGLVVIAIVILPVSFYTEIAPTVADAVLETEILGDSESEMVSMVMDDYVTPMNESGVLPVYRTLGGKAFSDLVTSFEINDTKTELADELKSVASFACNVYALTQTDIAEYGSKEAVVFVAIADSFEDSVLLPTIAGEFIYGATDAWLSDRAFLGLAKPTFGEMDEIFSPFFDTLLHILRTDSRDYRALQADIHTVAEMVSKLAEYGVFANLSDVEALMSSLSSNGVVNSLITTLGSNESMKLLIPEITNMGVRAIATTLGIPADTSAVYGEFLDDVAVALNDLRDISEEKRIETLSQELTTAFDKAGIPIDNEIIDCYSVSMIEDLLESTEEDLTADDVQAFFAVYALSISEAPAEVSNDATEGIALREALSLSDLSELFEGTVYEGKSMEELQESGAAVLAVACRELSLLTQSSDKTVAEQAVTVLQEAYNDLLSGKTAHMEKILNVDLKEALSSEALQATAGLQSADQMVTQKVTMNDLLVNVEEAANAINAESLVKESEAIAAIFGVASDLSDQLTGSGKDIELDKVAGSVGTILDSLKDTSSFGSDKTADLFTAVLQSETVRDAAKIDMKTATQMAQKATEGEGDYTTTMNAVASGVQVFTKLGQNGEEVSEEELVTLIQNINPQTAGMIEIYVTAERIEGYGVKEKYSATSAEMISSVFSYMARNDLPDYKAEAKALNQVLNVAISAKSNSSGKQLFTNDKANGILPSATETVEIFMASHAVSHALRTTILDQDGAIKEGKFDVFEIGDKIPENSKDYTECVNAMQGYYADHRTDENRQTLYALAALLGIVNFELN